MTDIPRMQDADLRGKRVVLRLDLNVPVQDGQVTDFTRIDRVKQTVAYLHGIGAQVRILAHFGRPKGIDPSQSLAFLAPVLATRWGVPVAFDDVSAPVSLMENIRFDKGEESDDPAFAAKLAGWGDAYVNDAFSVSHRAHASVHGITKLLPSYAGYAMQAELDALFAALEHPTRPVAAVVGGAKVSTKLDVLKNLVAKVDVLILGGGMANTFLAAQGVDVKASLCERDMLATATEILATAKASGCTVLLPTDVVVADKFAGDAAHKTVAADAIPDGWMALDLGQATVKTVVDKLAHVKTVVWNGPLGAFELAPFAGATNTVAQTVAKLTKAGVLKSVAGGGDTLSALATAGVEGQFSYESAAGGAFLEWLEGRELPGVSALLRAA